MAFECTKDRHEIAGRLKGRTISGASASDDSTEPDRDFLMISFEDGSFFYYGRKPEGSVEAGITYGAYDYGLAVKT